MSEYVKQHYVPNGILKKFGNKKPNGKYEVCLIDLLESKVEYRNTNSVMYSENIYDTDGSDAKELENKLKTHIEDPMFRIINRISEGPMDEVNITRRELQIIKKYMLIQIFRTTGNREGYVNPPTDAKLMSDYNIKANESHIDFWKRELMTILDSDWDSLVNSTDLVSVKIHAQELHTGFLIFFKTKEEFVINDRGYTCERFPIKPSKDFIESAKEIFKSEFNINDLEKIVESTEESEQYIDIGIWMPLSANLAVVNAHGIFTEYLRGLENASHFPIPLENSKLYGYLSEPERFFRNQKIIEKRAAELIEEYKVNSMTEYVPYIKSVLTTRAITENKDDDDKYRYKIHELGPRQTMDWNHMVMNETYRYLCIKTPLNFIPTIDEYNKMKSEGAEGIKKDYTAYADKIRLL